jgi:serine/threonine-protein kinase HipA
MIFPAQKYSRFNFDMLTAQVADLMGSDAAMDLIRRIVFNVGIGNGDMHAKNWSIVYRDGRTPCLAPAYDYLSTIVYLPNDDLGMNLAETKAFAEIDTLRIGRLAARARLSTKVAVRAARDVVARMRGVWPIIKDTLPIDEAQRTTITAHMESVPLFSERGASYRRQTVGGYVAAVSRVDMRSATAAAKA